MITSDTGVALSTLVLPEVVDNRLQPLPPLTGPVDISVLGGPLLWPAPGIQFVPEIIITGVK